MEHIELSKIQMTKHPRLNERWVQNLLADNPALLGLGDLVLHDRERHQPRAGRLDILLRDPDSLTRYEVELQLGATDESHIIRTLEYWDIERRRYPQYDHIAVIVAEEITSRFFNVISLFNRFIPIAAIQMTALRIDEDDEDKVSLVFTKVMDHTMLGTEEEDQIESTPADRNYWLARTSQGILELVDRIFSLIKENDPDVELNYNKQYIGLARLGVARNYVSMVPTKARVNFNVKHSQSETVSARIKEDGVGTLPYDKGSGNYRVTLYDADIDKHRELLLELIDLARKDYTKRWG